MQITITGRHNLKITPALHSYATEKLDKLTRHFDRITSIEVTFDVENTAQIAAANMHVPGASFHADSTSGDMYSAIDLLIDKLDRQIRDHKERERNH